MLTLLFGWNNRVQNAKCKTRLWLQLFCIIQGTNAKGREMSTLINPNAEVFTLSWSIGEPTELGTETPKDQPTVKQQHICNLLKAWKAVGEQIEAMLIQQGRII